MSIASEITRINNNIASAYDECETKGATMPATENSANLATTIASIPSGGGDLSEYFKTDYTSNTGSNNNITNQLLKKIPNITLGNKVTSLTRAFTYWSSKTLDLPTLDLTNITDLSYMFTYAGYYNGQIEEIDLSKLNNANNITNVSYMFNNAGIKTIKNLSALNSASVKNCSYMFTSFSCPTGTELDLSVLDKWQPTAMKEMFRNTTYVGSIDLRNIDTSLVADMSGMFQSCAANTVHLEDFDTSNVTNFSSMFYSMQYIKYLDISNFEITSATNINFMIGGTYKLAILDISGMDFTTPPTNFQNVFQNCGKNCLQTDGAYADGIPYVYVKDATAQNWVLTASNGHPSTWTTDNVVIKQTPSN